jgi:PAS domain S-box-containing protein
MCTFLNGRWKELTGRNTDSVVGNHWIDAIHPEDKLNIWNSWQTSLAKRSVFEAKFRMLNSTGGHTVCYAHSLPRYDSHDNFIGYTGTIQDFSTQERITTSLERMVLDRTNDLRIKNVELSKAELALKQKNAELEKINNELSSFAHVASHDLQEPLRKIQTFIDRVVSTEGKNLSQNALGFMNNIENASGRMRSLIRDILLYSQASNAEATVETIDLNTLVKEVFLEFEIKLEEKNALIEIVNELPVINVTRFQFHQLFLNLISNSLKFSRPGIRPHIKISSCIVQANSFGELDRSNKYYKITVADNGIGFNPEHSGQIFEMFNRLHTRETFEGTGIGLAICKKIVERHAGKLVAEGHPGKGALFHIYLPYNENNSVK